LTRNAGFVIILSDMSNLPNAAFRRPIAAVLAGRLREPRRFLQIVVGPRQVGKTTLVEQVVAEADRPSLIVSADEPMLRDTAWLSAQWERARLLARKRSEAAVLVIDEVQKVSGWSEAVKWHWDEDTRRGVELKVVLLGSAPLLIRRGLSESLAGRFETVPLPHWSFAEMRAAFGFSLDDYLFFGGYPGAAALVGDVARWRRYVLDSLVETTVGRDILLLSRVDKPALLRRLFELGCRTSGQILSYTKMLGQLQDVGNTVTLAHYLDLLSEAGMLTGLQKYAEHPARRRGSSPKLQVFNTALLSAVSDARPADLQADGDFRGRLVESAVGSHLVNAQAAGICRVHYWRDRGREVDYIVSDERTLLAIEVKSGRRRDALPGLAAFHEAFRPRRRLLVGGDGMPVESFLETPVAELLRDD
jgi:predicted AAA+ superfamily ATPase